MRLVVDRDAVEGQFHAAGSIDPARSSHVRNDSTHNRAGRNEHLVPLHGISDRRGLESLLILRGARVQARLQPDIEFFTNGNSTGRRCRTDVGRGLGLLGARYRDGRASERDHDHQ
jgi:hypothetical protein